MDSINFNLEKFIELFGNGTDVAEQKKLLRSTEYCKYTYTIKCTYDCSLVWEAPGCYCEQ